LGWAVEISTAAYRLAAFDLDAAYKTVSVKLFAFGAATMPNHTHRRL